jgi:protein-S-isoprenylcysteine O-methyltransferase Ste14
MPETKLGRTIYRWRVRSSLFLVLLILILAKPAWKNILIGLAVCALGLLIRAWASGHIKKEKELAVTGPYQYTRNPLYLGNFILGLSIAFGTNSWWCVLIFAAYFLVFYPPVIREERERMKRLFPDKYEEYKKKVPLFFPRLKTPSSADPIKFSWSLYKKNREYRALFGSIIFWAILIGKMLILP